MEPGDEVPDFRPPEFSLNATLSEEEFGRMQQQLLELRNHNYELIEENKRLRNYVNTTSSRINEPLSFASKFIGRKTEKDGLHEKLEQDIRILRSKLSSQEEEFRLQQSTLLSELSQVISRCENLERQLKEKQRSETAETSTSVSDSEKSSGYSKTNEDLEKIVLLKGTVAEKGLLIEQVDLTKEDLVRSKDSEDSKVAEVEKSMAVLRAKLKDAQKCNVGLEKSLQTKNEEIALLNSRLESTCEKTAAECCANEQKIVTLENALLKANSKRAAAELISADAEKRCEILSDELSTLKAAAKEAQREWNKRFDDLCKKADEEREKQEKLASEISKLEAQIHEEDARRAALELLPEQVKKLETALSTEKASSLAICADLAQARQQLQLEKNTFNSERAAWEEERRSLCKEANEKKIQAEELARTNEAEIFVVTSEFEAKRQELEGKVKEVEERLKAKEEEMKVALKKQSSMVRELRRQVQQEKKRAEQAERQLEDVLGGVRQCRIGGSPLVSSDHSRSDGRLGAEAASSVCSWAFVAESDRNSVHTMDGEESSCSASILESDNFELISRLAVLQKKHAETVDRLNMVEEENSLLRKEVAEKSELIAEWIRTRPLSEGQQCSSSPSLRLRRVIDLVRVDESAADIRDMNRRLQRMLEETLSKNLLLQKDMQILLENNRK